MKNSLILLGCFALGLILAFAAYLPDFVLRNDYSVYALYLLIFLVGVSIGRQKNLRSQLKSIPRLYLWLPLGTIGGTLAGSALGSFVLPHWSLWECLSVGAGFGYYSLSSVIITQYKGAALGSVALFANILREIIALTAAPFLVKYGGKLSVISIGGATSMDTSLPVILKYSGKKYGILSIYHGFTVDFSVPFLVSFFVSL